MADGMFRGRAFTIPYDTTMDERIASMARAQITRGVMSPGTVLQVGDQVMPVGITQQQVHMGDLDIKLRSFHQLSNEAQNVVRNNIQWQYGEQVGDVQKGFFSELFGLGKYASPFKKPVEHRENAPLPQPEAFPRGAETAPQAAPSPAARSPKPPKQEGAAPRRGRKPKATPSPAPAPETTAPETTAPAAPTPKRTRRASKKPVEAPALSEVTPQLDMLAEPAATPKADATPAAPLGSLRFDPKGKVPTHVHAAMVTALHSLARTHKKKGGDADFAIGMADGRFISSRTARGGGSERHVLSYDPETQAFVHTFEPGDASEVTTTSFNSLDDLHTHIRGL
jgi:hypothetical protein